MGLSTTGRSDYLFEVSWEVCAQVGGIYTVVRSKAPAMIERWGDHYCLVGPYKGSVSEAEFERLPPEGWLAGALECLARQGVTCHYGRWLVTGYPRVILIEYGSAFSRLGDIKSRLWLDHQIGMPEYDHECDEVIVFSAQVERLFEALVQHAPSGQRLVGHFHEWMVGPAVQFIRHRQMPVALVFTTHATLLGRYVCMDMPDFYGQLEHLNPDVESGRRGIYHRYCIERGAASAAHVFTTVSKVTASEADCLLKRRPDVITPNGLRIKKFSAPHEFQNLHRQYKWRLHEFVMGHFFGSYPFDLSQTVYFFLAGRYEYRNKGMDLYLDALAGLNERLKKENIDRMVVAFIVTRGGAWGLHQDVLDAQFKLDELRRVCAQVTEEVGHRLFASTAAGRLPEDDELLGDDTIVKIKRLIQGRRRHQWPLVVTHHMKDDANDPILQHIRRVGLVNSPEDRVKVVYHPDFISPANPLFGLEYDQFVRGCHLGVFPSYYEPWGYTPAECTALGVPSISTDLSGFGTYIRDNVQESDHHGIFVLPRRGVSYEYTVGRLTEIMTNFCSLSSRERISMRNRVESLSDLLAWRNLSAAYHEASRRAIARAFGA